MSRYCMNCGVHMAGDSTGYPWRDVPVVLYCDDGVDGDFEGQLFILECPHCGHQQIDLTGQYGNLPLTEDVDDDDEQAI